MLQKVAISRKPAIHNTIQQVHCEGEQTIGTWLLTHENSVSWKFRATRNYKHVTAWFY